MGSFSLKDELYCLLDPDQQTQTQTQFIFFGGNQAKIQKVPPYLRGRSEFEKYYFPKVVSIGPIHHPKGEEYKKMWASTYLKKKVGGLENAEQLLTKIRSEIQEKEFYAADVTQNMDKDKLSWILFVDGCAALHVIHRLKESPKFQALEFIVLQDLLLLENQLPYQVLKILSNYKEDELKNFLMSFLEGRDICRPQSKVTGEPPPLMALPYTPLIIDDEHSHVVDLPDTPVINNDEPAHLLDLLVSFTVNKQEVITKPPDKVNSAAYRNIQELMTTAGIKVKKNDKENLTSIRFRDGTLYIPPLQVDEFTAQIFLNMIAYEMCPDNSKTNLEISNYVAFISSLIDHAEDVKVLRNAGVINNYLGSDEEVAKVFNTVGADLVVETGIYNQVRQDIEKICKRQVRNWFIELQLNHFNTPWAIIGLISAILGFILTVVSLKRAFGPN